MNELTCYKGLGFNSYIIRGAIATYISAVMPIISESLSLTYTQVGLIFAGNSVGILIGAVIMGMLIDHFGTKKPLLLAFGAFPAGVILFVLAKNVSLFFIANVIIGLSTTAMEVGIAPISRMFKGGSGKILNLIHAFYALGSMISPLAASFLISRNLPFAAFFFVIAGYTCIPLYFSNRLSIHIEPVQKTERGDQKDYLSSLLRNKFFWFILFAQFFYVASEGGVFSWAPIYSTDYLKNTAELSSLLPSTFWVGLLVGRLLSSRFVDKVGHLRWLVLITAIGLPITFLAQMSPSPFMFLTILTVLSGLMHASVTPTLQSLLVETVNKGLGFALSLFSVASSFGYMLSSFVIGNVSTSVGIKWGYFIPFLFFSGIFVMIMLFVIFQKREDKVRM
ncbi:MAG TPA: MFS transporter [Thermotogota bacterium]|nr:MFS transporter [Thermotogota bacterium]HPJ88305.1 MFS transporter [Thermotogota bacterium]HPR95348.1 MFS transporter [Thermotogota bacterium]